MLNMFIFENKNIAVRFRIQGSIYDPFKHQYRSSRLEVFCKKGVVSNFAKFTENTCARVSF